LAVDGQQVHQLREPCSGVLDPRFADHASCLVDDRDVVSMTGLTETHVTRLLRTRPDAKPDAKPAEVEADRAAG
jgi:hypothetical protein